MVCDLCDHRSWYGVRREARRCYAVLGEEKIHRRERIFRGSAKVSKIGKRPQMSNCGTVALFYEIDTQALLAPAGISTQLPVPGVASSGGALGLGASGCLFFFLPVGLWIQQIVRSQVRFQSQFTTRGKLLT